MGATMYQDDSGNPPRIVRVDAEGNALDPSLWQENTDRVLAGYIAAGYLHVAQSPYLYPDSDQLPIIWTAGPKTPPPAQWFTTTIPFVKFIEWPLQQYKLRDEKATFTDPQYGLITPRANIIYVPDAWDKIGSTAIVVGRSVLLSAAGAAIGGAVVAGFSGAAVDAGASSVDIFDSIGDNDFSDFDFADVQPVGTDELASDYYNQIAEGDYNPADLQEGTLSDTNSYSTLTDQADANPDGTSGDVPPDETNPVDSTAQNTGTRLGGQAAKQAYAQTQRSSGVTRAPNYNLPYIPLQASNPFGASRPNTAAVYSPNNQAFNPINPSTQGQYPGAANNPASFDPIAQLSQLGSNGSNLVLFAGIALFVYLLVK